MVRAVREEASCCGRADTELHGQMVAEVSGRGRSWPGKGEPAVATSREWPDVPCEVSEAGENLASLRNPEKAFVAGGRVSQEANGPR